MQVITKDAITDEGLFIVTKTKVFFETLISTWIKTCFLVGCQTASNLGGYVNAGSETNEQLIVWQRFQDKILIKIKSFSAVANDSLPMYFG
jgi:hypothetical protein